MTRTDKDYLCNAIMFLTIVGLVIALFYIKITAETPNVKHYKSSEIRRFEYPEDGVVCYAYDDFKVGSISCVPLKGKADVKK